jgi:TRAP-type C4-dicarboxylate transport system permease small subunit
MDEHFEETIIFITLSSMSIIIGLQVVMRYVFHSALSWSEELARYLFIWLIYIGISYGVKRGSHVAVTAINWILSGRAQHLLKCVSTCIFLIFAIVVAYHGQVVCATIARLGQHAPATGINMWIVYAAVPTGFTLTCVRLLQQLYLLLKFPSQTSRSDLKEK